MKMDSFLLSILLNHTIPVIEFFHWLTSGCFTSFWLILYFLPNIHPGISTVYGELIISYLKTHVEKASEFLDLDLKH